MNKRTYFFLVFLAGVITVHDVHAGDFGHVDDGSDSAGDMGDEYEDLLLNNNPVKPEPQPSETPEQLAERLEAERLQQQLLAKQRGNNGSVRIDRLTPPPGGPTKGTSANPDNPIPGRPTVLEVDESVAALGGTPTTGAASLPEATVKTMRITLQNIHQFIPLLAAEDQSAQFVPHAIRILELMENFKKEVSSAGLEKLGVTQEFARTKLLLEKSINNKQIQVASKLLELYGTYESDVDQESKPFSPLFKTQALALFGNRVTSFTVQDPALQGYFEFKSKVQSFLQAPGAPDRAAFLKLVTEQLNVGIDEQSNLQLKMADALKTPLATTDPDFEASFARAMEALDTQDKQLQQVSQNAVTDGTVKPVVEPVTDSALPTTDPDYQKFTQQIAADNKAFEAIDSKLNTMKSYPENYTTTEVAQTLKSLKQLVNSMSIRSVFPKGSLAYNARARFIAGLEEKISAIEESLTEELASFKPSFTKASWSFFKDENYTLWDRVVNAFNGGGKQFANSTQEINDEKTFVALAKDMTVFTRRIVSLPDSYTISDISEVLEFVDRLDTQMQQLQKMGAKKLYAKVQEALQPVPEDNSVAVKPAQKVTVASLREQLQTVVKDKVVALLEDPQTSAETLEEASAGLKGMNDPVIKQLDVLVKAKQMLQATGKGLDYLTLNKGLLSLRNVKIEGINSEVVEGLRTAFKDKMVQLSQRIVNDPQSQLSDIVQALKLLEREDLSLDQKSALLKTLDDNKARLTGLALEMIKSSQSKLDDIESMRTILGLFPESDVQSFGVFKTLNALCVLKGDNPGLLEMQTAVEELGGLKGISVQGAQEIKAKLEQQIADIFDPMYKQFGKPAPLSVSQVSLDPLGQDFFRNNDVQSVSMKINGFMKDYQKQLDLLKTQIKGKPTDEQMRQLVLLSGRLQVIPGFIGLVEVGAATKKVAYQKCSPQQVRALLLTADPRTFSADQKSSWVRQLLLLDADGNVIKDIFNAQNNAQKIVAQLESDGATYNNVIELLNQFVSKPKTFSAEDVSQIAEALTQSVTKNIKESFLESFSKMDAQLVRSLLTFKEHQNIAHLQQVYRDLSIASADLWRPFLVREYVCEQPPVTFEKFPTTSDVFVNKAIELGLEVSKLINQN